MRIILADDQAEVRSGLKILLEQEKNMSVVGEASGTEELLVQIPGLEPDLVLLDWELSRPTASGIVPVLRKLADRVRIIALSGRPEARRSALASGVDAFVSKGDQPGVLLQTIKEICMKDGG